MKDQMRNKLRDKAGFTLVELIVVIAILGILAGIGTVGYSGYVKKANQAADNMLLDTLNTAFGVSCMEENVDARSVSSASVSISESGTSGLSVSAGGANSAAIADAFNRYFADSMSSPWKYYEKLMFVTGKGIFTGVDSGLAGTIASITEGTRNTSFEGAEADIMGDIQSLTNAMKSVMDSLGVDTVELLLGGTFGDYLRANGIDSSDSQAVANYATLFLADQVSNLTDAQKEKIAEIWSSNDFNYKNSVMEGIKAFVDDGTENGTGLSTMGAMALYYANAEACIQNLEKNYNPSDETAQAQKQAVIDAFKNISTSMGSCENEDDVWNTLAGGYQNMINATGGNEDLIANIMGYGSGNGSTDSIAFTITMDTINKNKDSFASRTDSINMYGDLIAILGG